MVAKVKEIKCVIWDLDNTIWDGILLEASSVTLRHRMREILKTLDERGILHSIASKNNYDDAMRKLKEFEIDEFFLYPQIHWNSKSSSMLTIQINLNIGMDTLLFVDDQTFEREEVLSVYPEIECIDAACLDDLLENARLNPRFITVDSRMRRQLYQADIKRKRDSESFKGPSDAFLASLNMKFSISLAREEDLERAEELTVRTHQLNATGVTYDYEELCEFSNSNDYMLLVCELTDKYGSYGKIGLSLVEKHEDYWDIKLLLMSCRVMSRGVGTVLLTYILSEALKRGVRVKADFRKTDKNKQMLITYKFANFKVIGKRENGIIEMENDLSYIQSYPSYMEIEVPQ